MEIKGKIAVVTGAGSGIGQAVALELARRGAGTLALADRSEAVNHVAASINEFTGGHVHACAFVGDVTESEFRRTVFDHVVAEHGVPRICVPAAGISRDSLAAKINKATGKAELFPIDDFRLVLEVNLTAPIYWALEMVGRIAEDRHARNLGPWRPEEHIQGTCLFIGSVSSQGNKGQIAYAATKAGLQGAAATLTKEAIFHGVRCGVIHPGFTDTPMVRALGEDYIHNRILPFTQLRRLIKTEEIADAICFMIGNSAVSGELWADAGWHPSA
jgi:NAD(P)-dependent dehydrogenase (short-subunit alcohol dehydrogenase family)